MRRALLAAGLLGTASAAGPDPRIVEQVVAVVESPASPRPRVITLTRLEMEARIALISRGATGAAEAELDRPALRAGLSWLVDQTLLLDEVVRLQVFEVDRAEALEELKRFQARFAAPADYRAFLSRHDITEEELLVVLRRMFRVQRYLDSRVSGAARVREADVDRLLRERGMETRSGAAGERARAEARARLSQERTRREVEALLADLRSRATIRILESFDGRG